MVNFAYDRANVCLLLLKLSSSRIKLFSYKLTFGPPSRRCSLPSIERCCVTTAYAAKAMLQD